MQLHISLKNLSFVRQSPDHWSQCAVSPLVALCVPVDPGEPLGVFLSHFCDVDSWGGSVPSLERTRHVPVSAL